MTTTMPIRQNRYASWRGQPMGAKPAGRGRLVGSLEALAVYVLRSHNGRVDWISEGRLTELYLKQRPGLLSAPDPRRMTVRIKPFRAWLLQNLTRITRTKKEANAEFWQHQRVLMQDYARNGPHFHNPAHRADWEAAQGY